MPLRQTLSDVRKALEWRLEGGGCRSSKMCAGKSQLAGASVCCTMAANGDPRMPKKKRGVV